MPRPRRTNKRLAPLFNQSSRLSLVVLFLVWLVERLRNAPRIRSFLAQAATCHLKGYQCQTAVVHGWGMKGVTVVPSFFVVPSYPKPNFEKLTIISCTKTKSPVFLPLLFRFATFCSLCVHSNISILSFSYRYISLCCSASSQLCTLFKLLRVSREQSTRQFDTCPTYRRNVVPPLYKDVPLKLNHIET